MNSHWKFLVVGYGSWREILIKTYCATEQTKDRAVNDSKKREGVATVEVLT